MEVEEKIQTFEIGYRKEFLDSPIIYGREIQISMPNGEKRKSKFAIVEASEILASHNEKTFSNTPGYPTINGENINDRNYKDDQNAQFKVMDVAQNLDPNILISTSRTPAGTPIITNDGIVVSGNNRIMSLKLAIIEYPEKYQEYKKLLASEAFAFGFSSIIGPALMMGNEIVDVRYTGYTFRDNKYLKFEHPLLVRIDYDFPEYNTTELSKYNKDTKKSERPIDKSIKVGKILAENENCKTIISNLVGEYETFSQFYANSADQKKLRDTLVDCNIISKNEIAGYFDERGFTEAGKDFVENMLAGLVLEKDALITSNTEGVRNFRSIIITSLPVLAKNNSLGPEYSLIPDINKAVVFQKSFKSSGLNFKDFMAQEKLFDEPPSKETVVMNLLLNEGRNAFKKSIDSYNNSVTDLLTSENLFGDKPTRTEIYNAHIASKINKEDAEIVLKKFPENGQIPTKEELTKPISTKNNFINDNFYSEHPDKILGEPYTASGRFGQVTKYKGNLEEALARIDAPSNFEGITKTEGATVSVENKTEDSEITKQNIEKAIAGTTEETAVVKKRKTKRIIATAPLTGADVVSFEEVFNSYNPDISIDELQVFVWYKNLIGQPLSQKWNELANYTPVFTPKKEWIENGLLAYYKENLIPSYLYYAENIWEKKTALEHEKNKIIELYGSAVYDYQKATLENVFKISYDKRLTLTDSNFTNRLKLLPISKFANTFKIKMLNDGKEFKMKAQAASGRHPGRPDFLYVGYLSEWKKTSFDSLTLTEAFQYWLVTYKGEYELKKDTDYAEIIRIYINQSPRPRLAADATPAQEKEAEAVWQRKLNITKDEGDRLFSLFLAEMLELNDQVVIETQWNEKYNGYLPVNYNKIPIAFSHTREYRNSLVDVRPEKREAVAFLMNEGSGALAYDVGVGKTWAAIFAIKQYIDAGYCKRPFICVPNQTYKQWLGEIKGLLPDVKVNDLYNLSADYIEALKGPEGQIQPVDENSISVITYEGLEQIGFNDATANNILNELYTILDQGETESIVGLLGKKGKQQAKKEASFFERLQMLIGRGLKGTMLNIEDLGFDFACYDEAHKMKKVFVSVKGEMKDAEREKNPYKIQAGGQPSSIALKGFMLTQYILKNNNYRNILLLTATPFTNSPLEIFSVLSFIAYEKLKQTNLNNLKSFFDNYVHATNELVINSKLRPERKQVVMGFNNLRSLQQLIARFINYKTGEMVNVKRPNKYVLPLKAKVINGETITLAPEEQISTQLPLNAQQSAMMADIKQYAEGKLALSIICKTKHISDRLEDAADDDSMVDATEGVELDETSLDDDEKAGVRTLRAMSFARNLALSPYLYDCSGLGNPSHKEYVETSPKLKYVMDSVKSVKTYHEKENTPVSGQVIYMDRGVEYFSLIKEYLVKEIGYKEHEVGIIKSQMPGGKDAKEKAKLGFLGEKYDTESGKYVDISDEDRIKIIIGSSTIKEGINLQKHSTVLYNCFLDWNPTDIKQLEGRIWRQGNLFKAVRIVNPMMEDSMDIFIFQKLEEKTNRISEIWDIGESNTFNLEEFNPSEIKQALISDPEVLAEMMLMEDKEKIKDEIRGINNEIIRIDKIIEAKNDFDENIEEFRKWVEEYRPSKEGSEKREFSTLLSLANEVLKKQIGPDGLPMERSYNRVSGKKYSTTEPASKEYYQDTLVLANRTLLKAEKEYLKPKSLSVKKLPSYKKSLDAKMKELQNVEKETTSEKAIKLKAQFIIEERAAKKYVPKSVTDRVREFETLNYLLKEKLSKKPAEKISPMQCPPLDEKGNRRIDRDALEQMAICLSMQPQTKELHTDKTGNYTEERKKLHEKIIASFKEDAVCQQQQKPIAILTGGAPGSGKTHFLKNFAPYLLSKQLFHIDADDVRSKLPEYKGWNAAITHFETKDIVNEMIDDIGKNCKYDLVYDGTMNKAKRYYELINRLKNAGYETYIIYIEVPQEVSEKRILERYQRTGRFVPMDVVQEVYDAKNEAFDQIKNMVKGWIYVDGMTGKIIKTGGEKIPQNRNYAKLTGTDDFVKGRKIEVAKAKALAQKQRLRILKLSI